MCERRTSVLKATAGFRWLRSLRRPDSLHRDRMLAAMASPRLSVGVRRSLSMISFAKRLIGVGMAGAFVSLLCHLGGAHPWIWFAMNGKEEDGRYYLASHGNYR